MDYNIINEFVQTLEQTKEICRRYEAGRLENNQLCNYYEYSDKGPASSIDFCLISKVSVSLNFIYNNFVTFGL